MSNPAGTAQKKRSQYSRYSGQFLVTQKVGARTFYFDNDNLTLDGKAHQVSSAIVAQADLGLHHDLVAQKQARYAARNRGCT